MHFNISEFKSRDRDLIFLVWAESDTYEAANM
jgi:hypothetical protein